MKIRTASKMGERHNVMEDFHYVDFNGRRLKCAVGDWAKNLVGGPYRNKDLAKLIGVDEDSLLLGGLIGSSLARKTIANSESTGPELIREINGAIARSYKELGIEDLEKNREETFTGYIGHLIATPESTTITAVGDVRVAVDGGVVAGKTKKIDIENARLRKRYIEQTWDIEGAYDAVSKKNIVNQYKYQNTPGHEFSYPAIDGTTTPEDLIRVITMKTPKNALMWSDGYITPYEQRDFTIEGLERNLKRVYEIDPYRYQFYPAVGYPRDDRTAIEIDYMNDWGSFKIEEVSVQ